MKYLKDFIRLKKCTENYWNNKSIQEEIYGFQIQKGTKWNNGLSEEQIIEFQNIMGFEFPEILKDYYTVMNGIDKNQINVFGNSGEPYSYSKNIYGFPDDIKIIKDLIQWIYKEKEINEKEMADKNISRIFPIYYHRFILIDHKEHSILSMYGNDIILYANNIIDLFYKDELRKKIKLNNNIKINYWLE